MADTALEAGPPGTPFREILRQLQELYRECGRECARRRPELIPDAEDAFVDRMVDLHRGLALKVFSEMALATGRLSAAEAVLAQELFEHAWGQRLNPRQTREALAHYTETTHLRWESLLRPFERFSSFIPRAGEVQELIRQLAWSVAWADGKVDRRSVRQLKWITAEVRRILETIPVAVAADPPTAATGVAQVRLVGQDSGSPIPMARPSVPPAAPQGGADRDPLAEALDDLDVLIGLAGIKQEVRELVNFLQIQVERAQHGLPRTAVSLHAVFTGNPGTGKTTVARLYGRLLGAMGVLGRGHLVETDRSGLVAEYAGQTGPKTNRRLDEALDGVLFIDEAYSLVAEQGDDPYGQEALQALLKRMEDDRARLVVVLAGYPGPMARLLRANPGLSSRFGRAFAFPDYTAAELGRIFQVFCDRDHYQLPAPTRARLLLGFQYLLDRRDEHFGNGRLARNAYERSVRRLATRLTGLRPLTRGLLTTLQPADVVLDGVPEAVWTEGGNQPHHFRLPCPACGQPSRLPQSHLGCRVHCPRCQHDFQADWGDPAPP